MALQAGIEPAYSGLEDRSLSFRATGVLSNGMRVIVNDTLTDGMEAVRKTWRERWLSWPWYPWLTYKMVPKPPTYIVDYMARTIHTTQRGYYELDQALRSHPDRS